MAVKMTNTLLIDFAKVNDGRAANGLPPLAWEAYAALLDARTPPDILAKPRDVAAGNSPAVIARAPDFLAYALPAQDVAAFVPPDVDPVLYARNLELTRGLMPYIVGDMRSQWYFALGITDAIPDGDKEETAAQLLAQIATYTGYDLAALTAQIQAQLPKAAGADVFRNIQNELGRTLQHVGGFTKRLTKIPVLNKIVGPMGVKVFGEVLAQTGNMLRGGSVRDWDDRAFVASLAETMHDMGMLCAVAAPWLPAPWNAVVAAIGAVSLAASKMMASHVAAAEEKQRLEREAKAGMASSATSPSDDEIVWAVNVLYSAQGQPPGWPVTQNDVDAAIAIVQSPRVQQMIAQGAQGAEELAGAGCACFV